MLLGPSLSRFLLPYHASNFSLPKFEEILFSFYFPFFYSDDYLWNYGCYDHLPVYCNGTLTFANRYSIRERSNNNIDKAPLIMIQRYSIFLLMRLIAKRSTISLYLAVPIVAYHSIDNNKTSDSTDIELFARKWNTYMIMVFRIGISWGLIHPRFEYDLYQKVDCVIFFF